MLSKCTCVYVRACVYSCLCARSRVCLQGGEGGGGGQSERACMRVCVDVGVLVAPRMFTSIQACLDVKERGGLDIKTSQFTRRSPFKHQHGSVVRV